MIGRCTLLGCLGLLFLSCTSQLNVYKNIDHAVQRNDFSKGLEEIIKGQERFPPIYSEKNAISLYLDKGLMAHYAGEYLQSSLDLQEAERLIEEAYTKSVTESISSYIINDNAKEYPGEDYEDIYLNVFNALNYYNRGNLEGAMVEIRKITIPNGKLDLLSRKYGKGLGTGDWVKQQLAGIGMIGTMNLELPAGQAVTFSNSALARYLSFLFYLGAGTANEARIEFEQVHTAYASNPKVYANPIPGSIAESINIPDGKARINVIAFVGLSPIKEEGLYNHIFPFFLNGELRWLIFKLPKFRKRESVINMIEVVVDGEERFYLELLEDIGAVVEETFNARFSNIYLKTFIRTLLKYAAADIAAAKLGENNSPGAAMLSATLAKAMIFASESADTRMARYFPGKAYIGGINLEPGVYTVTINYYSNEKIITKDEHINFTVRPDALNLIEAISLK